MTIDRSLVLLAAGVGCYALGTFGPPGLAQVAGLALAMAVLAAAVQAASRLAIRAVALCLMMVSAVLLTVQLYAQFAFRTSAVGG